MVITILKQANTLKYGGTQLRSEPSNFRRCMAPFQLCKGIAFGMSRLSVDAIGPPHGKYSEIRRHLKFNFLPSTNLDIAKVAQHKVDPPPASQ